MRSPEEIKMRCKLILDQPGIVSLVNKGSSPTATYEMIFAEFEDASKAKAGRWLSILRRDYPSEYSELIQSILSHAKCGEAQNEKEE